MPPGRVYRPKYAGNFAGLYMRCVPETLRSVTFSMGGQDIFTVLAEDLSGGNILEQVVTAPPGGVLLTKDAVHHPDVLVFTYDVWGAEPREVQQYPLPFTHPVEWTDVASYDVMLPHVEVHYDGKPARPFTLREPGPPTRCTFFERKGVPNVLRVQCGLAYKEL